MENNQVNFKSIRDFGEIFNSAFAFIGEEFKPLGKAILLYAMPFLIVASIIGVVFGIQQQQLMNSFKLQNSTDLSESFSLVGQTYKYLFLIMLLYMVGMSVLQCTIMGYIKLYIEKGKGNFTTEEVWNEIKPRIFPVLGISLICFILIIIGFIFCVIPGIILAVSLSLILPAYFYEEKGFGNAFNRSFQLTGEKWWLTFGLLIVSYILVYVMMLLLSIPSILMGFKTLFAIASHAEVHISTGYYILNSITQLVTYMLFSIPLIILIFNYFSLVELKDRPSLQEKIDQIS
jgi:hypothetical protein